MPKKIKNNALQKYEKANCILSVVLMAASLGLSISLITLLSDVMNEESKYGCYVIAGCYLLFTLLALAHCIQGVVTYKNTESYSAIFRSIGSGAAFFAGLVNAQFMTVMTLSAMGKTSVAEKSDRQPHDGRICTISALVMGASDMRRSAHYFNRRGGGCKTYKRKG